MGFTLNPLHLLVLERCRKMSTQAGSMGGALDYELHSADETMAKAFNELVRADMLEQFDGGTRRPTMMSLGTMKHDPNGIKLYRITATGAMALLEEAMAAESQGMETRIAMRLEGVPPKVMDSIACLPEWHREFHGINLGLVADTLTEKARRKRHEVFGTSDTVPAVAAVPATPVAPCAPVDHDAPFEVWSSPTAGTGAGE